MARRLDHPSGPYLQISTCDGKELLLEYESDSAKILTKELSKAYDNNQSGDYLRLDLERQPDHNVSATLP